MYLRMEMGLLDAPGPGARRDETLTSKILRGNIEASRQRREGGRRGQITCKLHLEGGPYPRLISTHNSVRPGTVELSNIQPLHGVHANG
jgi:hypothetical protein